MTFSSSSTVAPSGSTLLPGYNPEFSLRDKMAAFPVHISSIEETAIVPIAPQKGGAGSSVGTFCEYRGKHYYTKIGTTDRSLAGAIATIARRTETEMNILAEQEYVAARMYQILGEGFFKVPETVLARLRVIDGFTVAHPLAQELAAQGINNCLRVCSECLEGYCDFRDVKVLDDEPVAENFFPSIVGLLLNEEPKPLIRKEISFMDYIERYGRPPTKILTPDGLQEVILRNVTTLAMTAKVLADPDVFGGSGGNAGVIWKKKADGGWEDPELVNLDPGYAFLFLPDMENAVCHRLLSTIHKRVAQRDYWVADRRDIQLSTGGIFFRWKDLTEEQKLEALEFLSLCLTKIQADHLFFCFWRDQVFTRDTAVPGGLPTEVMPWGRAYKLSQGMLAWIKILKDIYEKDLHQLWKKKFNTEKQLSERLIGLAEKIEKQKAFIIRRFERPPPPPDMPWVVYADWSPHGPKSGYLAKCVALKTLDKRYPEAIDDVIKVTLKMEELASLGSDMYVDLERSRKHGALVLEPGFELLLTGRRLW